MAWGSVKRRSASVKRPSAGRRGGVQLTGYYTTLLECVDSSSVVVVWSEVWEERAKRSRHRLARSQRRRAGAVCESRLDVPVARGRKEGELAQPRSASSQVERCSQVSPRTETSQLGSLPSKRLSCPPLRSSLSRVDQRVAIDRSKTHRKQLASESVP